MLISFSGLGGSGKSTHIGLLREYLQSSGCAVRVVPLRDHFWWTKAALRLHGPALRAASEGRPLPRPVETHGIKRIVRLLFYFADSWRIYFFVLRPWNRSEAVIADRYFYDFFAELEFGRREMSGLARFLVALLPRPRLAFYFYLPPAQAQERKYEYPLPVLELQQAMYESVFSEAPHVRVRAAEAQNQVAETLQQLVRDAFGHGASSRTAYTAYLQNAYGRESSWDMPALDIPDLLRAAIANRMLWSALQMFPGLAAHERIRRVLEQGARMEARRRVTQEALAGFTRETGIEVRVVKDAGAVDQGTDVDVALTAPEGLRRLMEHARTRGWQVREVGEGKADVVVPDGLPLDAHVGFSHNGFLYVGSDFINKHPYEAEALIIISHAVTELTLVTLGDILKVRLLEDKGLDWDVAREEARRNGWEGMLSQWLHVHMHPHLPGQRLPHALGIWPLLYLRLRRYIHKMDGLLLKDLYDLARSFRARAMGRLPFHEPWAQL